MLYVCGGRYVNFQKIDRTLFVIDGPLSMANALGRWRELSRKHISDSSVRFEMVDEEDIMDWKDLHRRVA